MFLTVTGVGPKVALNILSVLPVEQIVSAVSAEDFRQLNGVPGVGTKTAQRLVLELKEKITSFAWADASRLEMSSEARVLQDAVEALVALGYNRNDARKAAERAAGASDYKRNTSGVITAALALLSKK